jgi:hypothetical protein
MNIYRVISDVLTTTIPLLDDGTGPTEDYAIAHLVAAESRSQAKWLAWRTDKDSWSSDVRDMPRFTVKLMRKGVAVDGPGIVSDRPEFKDLWGED